MTTTDRLTGASAVLSALAPGRRFVVTDKALPLPAYRAEGELLLAPNSPLLNSDGPGRIDTARGRHEAPLWAGAILHQVAHEHHGPPHADHAWHVPLSHPHTAALAEIRVEAAHVRQRPQDAKYLRAYALASVPVPVHAAPWLLAAYAVLILGRVEAGVIPQPLVQDVEDELRLRLGARAVTYARSACQDAIGAGDAVDAGERVSAYFTRGGQPRRGAGDRFGLCVDAPGAKPQPPDEEFEDPDHPDMPPSLMDACLALRDGWARAAVDEDPSALREQQRMQAAARLQADKRARKKETSRAKTQVKRMQERQRKAEEKAAQQAAEQDASQGEGADPGDDAGDTPDDKTSENTPQNATLTGGLRAPRHDEKRLATLLRKALREAQTRDRGRTKVRQTLPPGRLNGRELIQRQVQVNNRQTITARPFTATVTTRTPEPPLTVALMVDTSGSMKWAESILGTFQWALAQATHHLDARFAAIKFGGKPTLTIAPGPPPRFIRDYQATGGNERFTEGYALIDSVLNLTTSPGARILIVVSDGQYTPTETRNAALTVHQLHRAGVHVLWVDTQTIDARHLPLGAQYVPATPLPQLPERLGATLARIVKTT